MKDQVSSLRKKGVKAVVLGPESSESEIKEASEGKFNLVFTSPEALFGSQRSTIVALKSKIKIKQNKVWVDFSVDVKKGIG